MQIHNPALIADIGGTNARFALVEGPYGVPRNTRTLPCAEYPGLADAAADYIESTNCDTLEHAVIAIATNVSSDRIKMTNHHWDLSVSETRKVLGLRSLKFINDFTALALALPRFQADECTQIGGGKPSTGQALGVLGPGTGLGVSGLVPAGDRLVPLQGEGGHATYGPVTEREAGVIEIIQHSYEHVSIERLVSGPGISLLYQSIAKLDGINAGHSSPGAVTQRAMDRSSDTAVEALDMFCGILGTAAGNLALTLGSRGGVYIGGGIVPQLGNYFVHSPFRTRFEAHGRFSEYLSKIPTYVIHSGYPAMLGAATALADDYQYLGITDYDD